MQSIKKILPAAVLAAFAGAAQAQTTLYGVIDMSYGKNEFVGESTPDFHTGGDDSSTQGNSTTRFGIKGSTDVGSGIKANFKMETSGFGSNGETTSTNFFNRQMWFGLSGNFGEVRLGKQDNVPYQVMGDLFDFNGSSNAASAQQWSTVAVTAYNVLGRQDRSLQYISPTMGGFKAHVGYQPQSNANPAADVKDVVSGAFTYTAGDFAAGISGQTKGTSSASGGEDFASAAASYDFKVVKLMAGVTDAGGDHKGYVVGFNAPVAGFNIGVHYAENLEGLEHKATELWINREIFKSTYAYAEYGFQEENDALVNPTTTVDKETIAIGVIYVF